MSSSLMQDWPSIWILCLYLNYFAHYRIQNHQPLPKYDFWQKWRNKTFILMWKFNILHIFIQISSLAVFLDVKESILDIKCFGSYLKHVFILGYLGISFSSWCLEGPWVCCGSTVCNCLIQVIGEVRVISWQFIPVTYKAKLFSVLHVGGIVYNLAHGQINLWVT